MRASIFPVRDFVALPDVWADTSKTGIEAPSALVPFPVAFVGNRPKSIAELVVADVFKWSAIASGVIQIGVNASSNCFDRAAVRSTSFFFVWSRL